MVGISVVIPVYNAGAFINKCLDAIIAQEGGTSYEIILVDDGSTDNSVEVIRQYQESKELKESGGRILLLEEICLLLMPMTIGSLRSFVGRWILWNATRIVSG